ncbi:MAG: cobalamin biosynthesis protein [Nitrosomonas sp.]|nr:cobalamin biosynthesis protein [Nitrosomonas sp.]MBP7111733.1 cobalamin biosynthesis protein [Nitrosomonas sp.]MBP9871796.1 cobalamin biosynthesis protein [Nitrosomonas sp.]
MTITLIVMCALLLDAWLGEARRYHPLVGFGNLAQAIERWLYADSVMRGLSAVLLLLLPVMLLIALIVHFLPWSPVFEGLLLYLAIGWNSLIAHARTVHNSLVADNLPEARQHVSFLVSRDTMMLDHSGVAKATVESVLENGNDAIFAAIFWFIIAGAPGAVTYRLVNTLDAMWGYRTDRYRHFGWAAARLDDVMNFIPARLTALSYAITGRMASALFCWRTQGITWKSPNAGPVMAAGAGSLGVLLGGAAWYHGRLEQRPTLGEGHIPNANDIERALGLIQRALLLWLVVIGAGEWFATSIISA